MRLSASAILILAAHIFLISLIPAASTTSSGAGCFYGFGFESGAGFLRPAAASETKETGIKNDSRPAAEEEIRDIKSLMSYEFIKDNRPLILSLLALLAAAMAFYLFLRLSRRKEENAPEPPPPPVPHDETALAALEELIASGLLEEERFKEFYTRLSLIIRLYTGATLEFNCADLYLEEITAKLGSLKTARKHIDAFEALESNCDLVKFAKAVPNGAEARAAFESAVNFIKTTRGGNFR
jgi:hypothetical protein